MQREKNGGVERGGLADYQRRKNGVKERKNPKKQKESEGKRERRREKFSARKKWTVI